MFYKVTLVDEIILPKSRSRVNAWVFREKECWELELRVTPEVRKEILKVSKKFSRLVNDSVDNIKQNIINVLPPGTLVLEEMEEVD